jgi:hypothetical protein
MDDIQKAIQGARAAQAGRIYGGFNYSGEVDESNILKAQDETEDDFEKAKSGVYSNTAENRKLGRVGQKYGEGKKFSDPDKLLHAINNVAGSGPVSKEKLIDVKKHISTELSEHGFNKTSENVYSNGKSTITLKVSNSGNSKYPYKISASKTEEKTDDSKDIKKGEEDDIEKSDIMNSLNYGSDSIKITKTGKEIKKQVDDVILPQLVADLEIQKNNADNKLSDCGTAPTSMPDRWWTDGICIDCGYKIYNWEETYVPKESGVAMDTLSAEDSKEKAINSPLTSEESVARREYNDIVRNICNIVVDIKACEILKGLKDSDKYELTPRQIITFKF